jgi:rhodanese-related sulfurtransferase
MIHLGAWSRPDFVASMLKDGDVLEFGQVRLRILETPGHALEALAIEVFDLSVDAEAPQAVLTGGTLLIGDVGLPEPSPEGRLNCHEMAGMLYDSLHRRLLTLPGETRVYPGLDAAAPCGVPEGSGGLWSTLEIQRRFNHALHPMSRSRFVRMICEGRRAAGGRPMASRSPAPPLPALPLDEFLRRKSAGLQSLDVRGVADYAGAHLEGSIHVGLDGPFGDWAGAFLDRNLPVGIVAAPGRAARAALLLHRDGFEVVGFLRDGMEALEARPDLVRATPRVTAAALAAELSSGRPPAVLDVRAARERRSKRIPGSRALPLGELPDRISELPPAERLVVCCSNGYRASIAASLLERACVGGMVLLVGGLAAWEIGR